MNEDDTFRMLRRTPFNDIKDMKFENRGFTKFTDMLESEGWTLTEFVSEYYGIIPSPNQTKEEFVEYWVGQILGDEQTYDRR